VHGEALFGPLHVSQHTGNESTGMAEEAAQLKQKKMHHKE